MTRLNNADYMKFPLTFGADGALVSSRLDHVREQIEQVLFTNPGERWFRPDFGAGILGVVFEPNIRPLWEIVRKRLFASLSEALAGEVDPKTLQVEVDEQASSNDRLVVTIAYTLAAINYSEQRRYSLGSAGT